VSLRLRVALLTALAVAIIEVAVLASMYAFMSQRLHADVEEDLRNTASVLVPIVRTTGEFPRPGQEPERAPNIRRLLNADGAILSARAPVDLPVTEAARRVAGGTLPSSLETVAHAGDTYSTLTVSAGRGLAVQVARSLASVNAVLGQLLLAGLVLGAAGMAAALLAGAAIATGALAPLRRLGGAVERITETGDLTQRVSARGTDEVATFAKGFDTMLARLEGMVAELEHARRAQRQLVADASHELRAPLATLRANVELLSLGADAPVGDRQELIADTLSGLEDLTTLVAQLIDLAREDQRVHLRAPVKLDDIVRDEVERMRRRYPGVRFITELGGTTVLGDAEAIGRAVANLLDNAGKWSTAGAAVQVTLRDGDLEVRDQGPGIDEADLSRVFERFYRGARGASVPGSGLGLAIVAQVMKAHGGEVSVRSPSDGGAIFTARFDPASS
jgi:two-component system sensor histidine kinase MprB